MCVFVCVIQAIAKAKDEDFRIETEQTKRNMIHQGFHVERGGARARG